MHVSSSDGFDLFHNDAFTISIRNVYYTENGLNNITFCRNPHKLVPVKSGQGGGKKDVESN